jgi:hypothetical protein
MAAMPAPRPAWKRIKVVAAWLAATALGIAVSSLGVRAVLDAAVPDRFLVLPAAAEPPPAARPTTRPATPSPSATGSRGTRSAPATPSGPVGPPSRSGPATSASAQPPVDGWTSLGDGQYLRSFHLTGGDAVVRAGQGEVRLVSATPRPGYTMTILPSGPDRVVVNFATALHVSTLTASWGATGPTAETTELP